MMPAYEVASLEAAELASGHLDTKLGRGSCIYPLHEIQPQIDFILASVKL